MNEEMLSIASQSDLEEMSLLNVPFMKELNAEIEAQRSGLIRWDVLKDDGVITGCHRTVLLSGWGFLYGVYVRPSDSNIWTCYKLVQHTVGDLSGQITEGFITWIDDQPSWKSVMMKRLDFTASPSPVYRIFFQDKGLQNLLRSESKEESLHWRMAVPQDCPFIEDLGRYNSSFVNSIVAHADFRDFDSRSGWLVGENGREVAAAIRWFIYGDTLFLMFSLSVVPELDITPAVIKLLSLVNLDNINTYRVNLEYQRKMTLLRLSGFSPYTNERGHETGYLSKIIKGTLPCENTN